MGGSLRGGCVRLHGSPVDWDYYFQGETMDLRVGRGRFAGGVTGFRAGRAVTSREWVHSLDRSRYAGLRTPSMTVSVRRRARVGHVS